MKRVLSFLMAVLLIVSLLPTHALHAHAAETSVTLNLSNSNNRTSFSATEQVWEENGITLTNNKASSSTDVANYTPPRFYASSSLTIAYSGGNITKIDILCSSSTYATNLKNSVSSGATASTSGSTVTITLTTPAESYTISSLSKQVRAGATVTVYYEAAASSCEHTNTTTTTVDATCTTTGSTTVTCDDCGEVVSTETIAALGHNYVDGVCSRCGNALPVVSFSVPDGVAAVGSITADEDGNVKMPSADDYDGKFNYSFVGWVASNVDNSSTQPATIYSANTTYKFTANTTLKALYTYEAEGTGASGWVQKDLASITASDVVVITGTNSSGTYAMSNNNGTGSAPSAVAVTVSGTTLTGEIADAIKWNVGGNATDGYIFYPNGSTSTWLYCTGTNNGVRVGTNAANTFKIGSGNYLQHQGTSRYIGIYNSQDWRCYTSINTNIQNQTFKFYVQQTGTAMVTYYTTLVEAGEDTTCEHTNTTTTTVDATCTAAGSVTVTCDDCEEVVSTTEIPATGHQNTTTTTVNATCTEAGSTTVTCDDCGAEVSKTEIAALGHNYVNGTCTNCGAAQPAGFEGTYYIAAIRTAGGNVYYMTADLGTASTKRYQAENSGLTAVPGKITEPEDDKTFVIVNNGDGTYSIYAKGVEGDNYLGWTTGNSGTFVAESSAKDLAIGYADNGSIKITFDTRKLTLNNNSGNDYFAWYGSDQANVYLIPVETCEHTYDEGVVTAPTCDAAGYTTYTCTQCGSSYTGNPVAALGHDWDEGTVTTPATCTTNGVKTYTCKNDATHTYTETIPASHTLSDDAEIVAATCEEKGSKTYSCTVCGESVSEEIPALGHDWDEGTVTTAATCETAGVMTFVCSRGCEKTEAIPATGHSYVNGTCEDCGKEISRFQLVTDYTKILAGGEYIIAAKVGDTFYAINSGLKAQEVTVTGTGANIMVEYKEGLPIWNLEYFQNRNDCFSIYNPTTEKYLTGTDSASLTTGDTAWAWTFIDGSTEDGEETEGDSGYGTLGVLQPDGSVAFVAASATVIDRAISLRDTEEFKNYSVRTPGYNRELYFFKMVEANETEYTVTYVENGISYSKTVPVNENVEILPNALQNLSMPQRLYQFCRLGKTALRRIPGCPCKGLCSG